MDKGKFFEEMQRLASNEQKTMEDTFCAFWFKHLKPMGFTDEDIEAGVSMLIHKAVKYPALGDLEKACHDKRALRINKEVQKSKAEENKHRHTSQEEILERGTRGSLKARAFVKNVMDLLNGRISKRAWIAKQRGIGVDGHAQFELRRIEKELPTEEAPF